MQTQTIRGTNPADRKEEDYSESWYKGERQYDSIRCPVLPVRTAQRLYHLHSINKKLRFVQPRQWHRRKYIEIRRDPAVVEVLTKWWSMACSNRDGGLPFSEYMSLNMCMYKALVPCFNEDVAKRSISADWRIESGGANSITFEPFCISICEVADVWAPGDSDSEYVEFLSRLLDRLTSPSEPRLLRLSEVPAAEDAVAEMLRHQAQEIPRLFPAGEMGAIAHGRPDSFELMQVRSPRTPSGHGISRTCAHLSSYQPKLVRANIPYETKVRKIDDGELLERIVVDRVQRGEAAPVLRDSGVVRHILPRVIKTAPMTSRSL